MAKFFRVAGSALMSIGFHLVVLVVGAEFYRMGIISPEMIAQGIIAGLAIVIVGIITHLAADQPKQPLR